MMVKALGSVWHQKQKKQGMISPGLHGLDQAATWSYSHADGWVYGHGTFCIATHGIQILGTFKWMPNSVNEAKGLATELGRDERFVKVCCMDQADDYPLYRNLKDTYDIQLLTTMRHNKIKAPERQQMWRELHSERHQRLYRERRYTVEPMQSLVEDIFDWERAWMRRNANNRWIMAAMGVAIQVAQRIAYQNGESTWRVKDLVFGI
jgi:hypothetical protein